MPPKKPKSEKLISTSIAIHPKLRDDLANKASIKGMSLSAFLSQISTEYLKNNPL